MLTVLETRPAVAQRLIDVRDFPRIGVLREAGRIRLRRRVRRVRVKEVDPEEPPALPGGQPVQGGGHRSFGRPLGKVERGRGPGRIPVIIDVEPFVQTEPGIQGEGADKGGRAVAITHLDAAS